MTTQRNSYTFKEGLTMMAAKAVGIDPYLAAEGGENARAAINAIRNAAKTKTAKDRAGFIREAQAELRSISAAQHPKLVNALQARLLALQGRGGDTEIAHLTPGEVVIPRSLQTPQLMHQIAAMAARQGIDTRQLTVGNRANKVNPTTGQREFIEAINMTGYQYPEEIVVTGRRGTGLPSTFDTLPFGNDPGFTNEDSIIDFSYPGVQRGGVCTDSDRKIYDSNNARSVELAAYIRALVAGQDKLKQTILETADPIEKRTLEDTLSTSEVLIEYYVGLANQLISDQKFIQARCADKEI